MGGHFPVTESRPQRCMYYTKIATEVLVTLTTTTKISRKLVKI